MNPQMQNWPNLLTAVECLEHGHIPNQMEDAEKVEQAKLGKCIRMHLEIFKKTKAALSDSLQKPCCILVYILESW